MKTCKDFDMELCVGCKVNSYSRKCWIEHFKDEIQEIGFKVIIDDYAEEPNCERSIYWNKALQIYYPEYWEKLQKLLALL